MRILIKSMLSRFNLLEPTKNLLQKPIFKKATHLSRFIKYRGNNRYCYACNNSLSLFKPAGINARENALCPICFSVERIRFTIIFLEEFLDIQNQNNLSILHVAPELILKNHLSSLPNKHYISTDLYEKNVDIQQSVTDIAHPNDSFDVIVCSHVLEHIPDDTQAMRELLRVLKPEGWALLLVPMEKRLTYEDSSISSPEERLRVFGQEDHVRIYGYDFFDRLQNAGWNVIPISAQTIIGDRDPIRYGIDTSDRLFFCTKTNTEEFIRLEEFKDTEFLQDLDAMRIALER